MVRYTSHAALRYNAPNAIEYGLILQSSRTTDRGFKRTMRLADYWLGIRRREFTIAALSPVPRFRARSLSPAQFASD